MLGKMPGSTLLARDLDHDLGGLAHDPLELGPRLGRRQHGIAPAPALAARPDPQCPPAQAALAPGRRSPGFHQAGERQDAVVILIHRPYPSRPRSEEHTSELQSLMRISYAVFC